MIEGLDTLLADTRQPALAELRAACADLLEADRVRGRVVEEIRLDTSGAVNRVRLEIDGRPVSFVAKRSRPVPAQRNSFVTERWLPAVGLSDSAPRILATAAHRTGKAVWHVYEDLGELTLEQDRDADAVRAGVSLLAEVHQRFAGHLMIAEAREWGGDLGCTFYSSSARDAVTCLEAIPASRLEDDEVRALRDRLLQRMWELLAEEAERTDAVRVLGGPETLVHGDLWLKNVSVVRERDVRAKLIDWDHAGVGPAGYDLSTFLNGFDAEDRDAVLDQYRDALAGTALEPPGPGELNALFDTFERARIANCVVWSAFAVSEGPHVEWAIEDLRFAEQWLAQLEPVLEAR